MSGLVASSSCTACQEGTTWSWEGSPQQPPSPRDPPTPSAVGSEEHPRVVRALPPQEPGPPQPITLQGAGPAVLGGLPIIISCPCNAALPAPLALSATH